VRVGIVDDRLVISVADDGVGFDPDAVTGATRSGIARLRERVTLSRGEVRIESAPGCGAQITIEIPIAPEAHQRTA
jgi:two-component system NarL family sensor kinase